MHKNTQFTSELSDKDNRATNLYLQSSIHDFYIDRNRETEIEGRMPWKGGKDSLQTINLDT